MTPAGDRSDRGYPHDDPAYPWAAADYPYPADPPRHSVDHPRPNDYPQANDYPGVAGHPPMAQGRPGAGYPQPGYPQAGPAQERHPGEGYPRDNGNPQDNSYPRDNGYRNGHRDRPQPEYWDEFRDAGYPAGGYPAAGPAGPQYPATGYPAAGYAPPGYRPVDAPTSEFRRIDSPRKPPHRDLRTDPWDDDPWGDARASARGRRSEPAPQTATRPSRSSRRREQRAESAPERPAKRRRLRWWQELPLLLVIAFCLAVLIRTFLLQAFFIPSGSMEDTLVAGDRVLASKIVYQFREPQRGEIVVFQGTDAWAPLGVDDSDPGALAKVGRTLGDLVGISRPGEKDYIKRVIGVPGDVVSCCDVEGRLFVNGQPINESYISNDSPLADAPDGVRDCRNRRFDEVVVEPGQLFVMGDHRLRSQDSRCQGQVPIENVIGRAFVIVWPTDRWASLSAPPGVFAGVPSQVASRPPPPLDTGRAGAVALVLPLLLPLPLVATRRSRWAPTRSQRRGRGRRLTA